MSFDLAAALPLIVPKAIEWAQQQESKILASGTPLDANGMAIAKKVGVSHPERICISFVNQLELPADPLLREAALATGLLGPDMIGLTLGYGIYICNGHYSVRLLSHECRHVEQYEQAGSVAAYLPMYLQQIVQFGYTDAPYEVDARAHEIHS